MLKLKSENEQLLMENTQLRSKLALANQDIKILKLKLGMIQENRDHLETQFSLVKAENEDLKASFSQLELRLKAETPILNGKSVHFEDLNSEKSFDTFSSSKKLDEEPEVFTETGKDFDSEWHQNISILESDPNYIVLKNNSKDQHQSLDDFIFSRIVDGVVTVTGEPLPLGIVMPPLSIFTVHANHPRANEVPSKSCILYRHKTFGSGRVIESVILDENGKKTANHILCVFKG